jgi:rhodanese-related sulfurtransferase
MQCLVEMKCNDECMIRYFSAYIESTTLNWNYILPEELYEADKENLFILDVRKPEDYENGHIEGAINIFWLELLDNLDKLPKNKEIIIVCYVGHTASQALVILRCLGYKARALKFGMGINKDESIQVSGWKTSGYPVVQST